MAESKPARIECTNSANHTPAPVGYLEWHAWAKRMGRTHESTRCPDCKLFTIWVPKPAKVKT